LVDGGVSGTLRMVGPANAELTGSGTISFLVVALAGTVTSSGTFTIGGLAVSSGTLSIASAYLENSKGASVDGIVTGTLKMVGTVNVVVSGSGTISSLEVAKTSGALSGIINTDGTITITTLTVTSGILRIGGDNQNEDFHVSGDANFQGGTLEPYADGDVLDVDGNVVFNGTSCTSAPPIRCGGNWTADASFAPGSGTVELDGAGPTTMAAANSGGPLYFSTLLISNGIRTAANDFELVGPNKFIVAGAAFDAGGRNVSITCGIVDVSGTLLVGADGVIAFGATEIVQVAIGGTLNVVGTLGHPATITGVGSGGYSLTISGTLAANHFVMTKPGANGIVIDTFAVLAAPPNDLRAGLFDFPANVVGAALLNIQRPAPTVLSCLAFQNSGGVAGASNIRCTRGTTITLSN
jgi:hypothetical protein